MTEPDEALIWAFEDDATRWVDNCPDLAYEEEREAAARGYRAGQAASAERIKALEEEVARLKTPPIPPPAPKSSRTVYLWSPAP